jgi:uncharacterized protein
MIGLSVHELSIYPVKSCAGVRVDQVDVEGLGLAHDRRWLIVDADTGKFITGRQCPELVLLRANVSASGAAFALRLSAAAPARVLAQTVVSLTPNRRVVTIWRDEVSAVIADDVSNEALSVWLNRPVQLVFFDAQSQRNLDPEFSAQSDQTAFADGFPILLISQASLDGLNTRLRTPIPMARFRPNIVIAGALTAHGEDHWRQIQIGNAYFDVVKPCTRCVFTTVDTERGVRDPSGEPLETLKSYRRTPEGIIFGVNLIPRGKTAVLAVGDLLVVRAQV